MTKDTLKAVLKRYFLDDAFQGEMEETSCNPDELWCSSANRIVDVDALAAIIINAWSEHEQG